MKKLADYTNEEKLKKFDEIYYHCRYYFENDMDGDLNDVDDVINVVLNQLT